MDEQMLLGKLWFPNDDTLLLKFPKGFADRKLPIKLERTLALVITDECIELRNLAIKKNGD